MTPEEHDAMNIEHVESIVAEYHGNNNASLKDLLIDACTISAGSPSIKLEAVAQ